MVITAEDELITGSGGLTTKIYQDETVYVLTGDGEIKPYLKLTRKIVDRLSYDREKMKDKLLDRKILETYFPEPGYSSMKKFAEENDLEFGVKEDLITILNHYCEVMGIN